MNQQIPGFFADVRRLQRIAIQTSVAGIVFILVVGTVVAAYFFIGTRPSSPGCDIQLSNRIGTTAAGLCLRPLNVVLDQNSLESHVPVLVMKVGATGTIDILYHISSGYYVSHPQPKPNMTSTYIPLALSVSSARVNQSRVWFSNGTAIFQNSDWIIYRYTVEAAADSTGYYAILPRYYWGMYPALAIGADSGNLSTSALSMWGYTGCCTSGEIVVPSSIVGTSGFSIVNETLPGISYCPNAACNLVSRSLY